MKRCSGCGRWLLALGLLLVAHGAALAQGTPIRGRTEIMFPMAPPGQPQPKPESGWRISYVIHPMSNDYGGSRAWQFTRIDFMKGYKDAAGTQPDWIRVLDDLVLTDMHVPYNDGETEYWDISSQAFGFVRPEPSNMPAIGCYSCGVEPDGLVAREVVDDSIRWTATEGSEFAPDPANPAEPGPDRQGEKLRRGQVMWLWTNLAAGNYRYIVKYGFADDGTIRARVGGTAHNYHPTPVKNDDPSTHMHTGYWRMQFNLGNPAKNHFQVTERITTPTSQPGAPTARKVKMVHRDFNQNREGGEIWNPYKFTAIKVMSMVTRNRHDPPLPVAYKLMPVASGIGRTPEKYTQRDFWVTRVAPDARRRRNPNGSARYEAKYIEIPEKIAISRPANLPAPLRNVQFVGEKIDGKAVVLWHQAGLNHMPRVEDFGPKGWQPYEGTALIHWAGFDLMPNNLWHKAPFYDAPPPQQ